MTMAETSSHIERLFKRFEQLNVLIIGDVMIDSYLEGTIERMSPEAPVPVVSVRKRYQRLGGAANVMLNINALGAKATLCSVIGNDIHRDVLMNMMAEHGLDCQGLVSSATRITTVKERVICDDKHLLRIDEEVTDDLSDEEHAALRDKIDSIIDSNDFDIIIMQDYNKGVLTEQVIREVIAKANAKRIPVAVDPKKKNFFAYKGVTLFKPNAKELREGLGTASEKPFDLEAGIRQIQSLLNCQYVLATLSENGLLISHCTKEQANTYRIAAIPRHIVDVSGAGDTVLSVASLCLAAKETAPFIAALSNIAGGLVCESIGVVPIDRQTLFAEAKRLIPDEVR